MEIVINVVFLGLGITIISISIRNHPTRIVTLMAKDGKIYFTIQNCFYSAHRYYPAIEVQEWNGVP